MYSFDSGSLRLPWDCSESNTLYDNYKRVEIPVVVGEWTSSDRSGRYVVRNLDVLELPRIVFFLSEGPLETSFKFLLRLTLK